LINQLRNDPQLSSQKLAIEALNDLELLFRYLTLFNVMDKVKKKEVQYYQEKKPHTLFLGYI